MAIELTAQKKMWQQHDAKPRPATAAEEPQTIDRKTMELNKSIEGLTEGILSLKKALHPVLTEKNGVNSEAVSARPQTDHDVRILAHASILGRCC